MRVVGVADSDRRSNLEGLARRQLGGKIRRRGRGNAAIVGGHGRCRSEGRTLRRAEADQNAGQRDAICVHHRRGQNYVTVFITDGRRVRLEGEALGRIADLERDARFLAVAQNRSDASGPCLCASEESEARSPVFFRENRVDVDSTLLEASEVGRQEDLFSCTQR